MPEGLAIEMPMLDPTLGSADFPILVYGKQIYYVYIFNDIYICEFLREMLTKLNYRQELTAQRRDVAAAPEEPIGRIAVVFATAVSNLADFVH